MRQALDFLTLRLHREPQQQCLPMTEVPYCEKSQHHQGLAFVTEDVKHEYEPCTSQNGN